MGLCEETNIQRQKQGEREYKCVWVRVARRHQRLPCADCAPGMRRMRLGVPYIIQFAQRVTGIVA